MRATLPLLENSDFPPIRRGKLTTMQVNLGYRCNQSCLHCHVNAGPRRTEEMTRESAQLCLDYIRSSGVTVLDLTGGAPEMNPNFRYIVDEARAVGVHVIDRCNLTILSEPGHEDLAEYLASRQVEVVASLPCYSIENVDSQRGEGVFDASIEGLRKLNALGYGRPPDEESAAGPGLRLSLVYNPQGPQLPPPQAALEAEYRQVLADEFGVTFSQLLTLANMPVGRFGSVLMSKQQFDPYIGLLRGAYLEGNLKSVMCRSLISVSWEGYVYDCDFNQMLGLSIGLDQRVRRSRVGRVHLSELLDQDLSNQPIVVREHCYGCTAGQGSSCGGALS